MIAVLKPGASPERTQHLIHWLEEQNLGVHVSQGEYQTVLGLIGNTAKVDMEMIQSLDIVESVTRVSDPFKAVNRKFHPEDSVIQAGPAAIGGGHFALIAGPCSVESEEQICAVAEDVKSSGAALRTCCAAASCTRQSSSDALHSARRSLSAGLSVPHSMLAVRFWMRLRSCSKACWRCIFCCAAAA